LEKCIAYANALIVPRAAETIDLYWDGKPKELSLDHAAKVPMPYFR